MGIHVFLNFEELFAVFGAGLNPTAIRIVLLLLNELVNRQGIRLPKRVFGHVLKILGAWYNRRSTISLYPARPVL